MEVGVNGRVQMTMRDDSAEFWRKERSREKKRWISARNRTSKQRKKALENKIKIKLRCHFHAINYDK